MQVYEVDDFEEILSQAETNAVSDWEIDFVSDMRDRYNQYGDKTLVTEKQMEKLESIANW